MATKTQTQPPSQQQPNQAALLGALTVVLLSGLPLAAAAGYVAALLAPLGISAVAAAEALSLILPHTPFPSQAPAPGTALGFANRTLAAHSAAYLLQAAKRLSDGGSFDAERSYLNQHVAAQGSRWQAAQRVDRAARLWGPLLGWYAIRDARTTPACREAHGSNLQAAIPPKIGYPGTLHGGSCRCLPGPAHPGASMVDEAVSSGV